MTFFKTKSILFILAATLTLSSFTNKGSNCSRINWTPPNEVTLKDSVDFDNAENDILECKKWMENNPFKKGDPDWTRANRLVIQWVTGSPRFHITLYNFNAKYSKNYLIPFMGGCAAYAIENNFESSDLNNFVAGFELVMKVYDKAVKKKKDKNILKLKALKEEGKLKEWVKAQLAKNNK